MEKFLEAKDIRILLFQLFHHFESCLATCIIITFHFNKAGDVPANYAQSPWLFVEFKCLGPVKSKKNTIFADVSMARDMPVKRKIRRQYWYK